MVTLNPARYGCCVHVLSCVAVSYKLPLPSSIVHPAKKFPPSLLTTYSGGSECIPQIHSSKISSIVFERASFSTRGTSDSDVIPLIKFKSSTWTYTRHTWISCIGKRFSCTCSKLSLDSLSNTSDVTSASESLSSFSNENSREFHVWPQGGGLVHSQAEVHSSATVQVTAVIHKGAKIGENCVVGTGSVVGPDVSLGCRTWLGFNVSLQNCDIGFDCILHNGVSVGQDGFGFFVNESGEMVKKPQLLRVKIGNNVEIGANSCVDRGSWRDTVVGDHCKLDNLVQIGHNVVLGRCCILCGMVGVGGSATLGDYVVLGGQVGVADHLTIVSKVRVGAKSAVMSNIKLSGDYAGIPAVPAREWRKIVVTQRKQARKGKHTPND